MNKKALFAGLLTSLLLASCGKTDTSSNPSSSEPSSSQTSSSESSSSQSSSSITVVEPTEVTIADVKNFVVMESTLQLTASVAPAETTDKTITWVSSDPTKATVSETGLVTPLVGDGSKVTITAKSSKEGVVAEKEIKLFAKNTGISIVDKNPAFNDDAKDLETLKLYPEDTGRAYQKTAVENACYYVTWESSDTNVVTINEKGEIKAIGVGTATITCKSVDDETLTDTLTVTVVEKPTAIVIPEGAIEFDLATDTPATSAHAAGKQFKDSEVTFTSGTDSLVITGNTKSYYDSSNNSKEPAIKLDGRDANTKGFIKFTVGTDVKAVYLETQKWKNDNGIKVNCNGTEYTISSSSNTTDYDVIKIDTTTTKIVEIKAVAGRSFINNIHIVK